MKLRIATRASELARIQTDQVIQALKALDQHAQFEPVPVVSEGDKIKDRSLAEIGGKGLFTKALEELLLAEKVDCAVHSLKDVPPRLDAVFCIPAVLKRESPNDVLVSEKYDHVNALPSGAKVGTCSVRRKAALLSIRPDLNVKMIRGNIATRLKKLDEEEVDALILAEAGLTRLGLKERITQVFPVDLFLPSAGQGIIAVECLTARDDVVIKLQAINDIDTFACMSAERTMNRALQASCTSPVGSFAEVILGKLVLRARVWSPDGRDRIETRQMGELAQAEKIGQRAADDLHRQGALALLQIQ